MQNKKSNNLDMREKCTAARPKTNRILFFVARNTDYGPSELIKKVKYSFCKATPEICRTLLVMKLH